MRKIPTLFVRDENDRRYVTREVNPECQWVLDGEGVATRKYDGTCVLIRRDGMAVHAYARREVKPGKTPPENFQEIETDPVTGKTVGWEPAGQSGFAKWILEALATAVHEDVTLVPGTYELIGPKVNGNPEKAHEHRLVPHEAAQRVRVFSLTYDGIAETVRLLAEDMGFEGLVWHNPDGRMAKIKARDLRPLGADAPPEPDTAVSSNA